MENSDFKQLLTRIPKRLHAEIKARAALRNISITLYVTRALQKEVARENRYSEELLTKTT
jgi:predicted HicB family RNase H-like nuclease